MTTVNGISGGNVFNNNRSERTGANGTKKFNVFAEAQKANVNTKTTQTGLPADSIPHLETDKNGNKVNNYYDENGKLIKSVPVKNTETELKVINQNNEIVGESTVKVQQQTVDIDEYLKRDENYQMHKEIYNTLKSEFVQIGRKYDVTPGDIDDAKKKITNPEDLQNYISAMNTIYNERNSLAAYRNEMENWQDGPLDRRNLVRRNGEATGTGGNYNEIFRDNQIIVYNNSKQYTNVERMTLSNGQHVWKSDQGVFYPGVNGKIGLDEVPAELLQ